MICESFCPKKVPPKSKASPLVRIPARRKRKLQNQLQNAEETPSCPIARLESLKKKLALAHVDIRDAVNIRLQNQEQLAVSKVKSNPKYFYSYAKKLSI